MIANKPVSAYELMPQRMRTLPRDKRGYPIPFLVIRDKTGEPLFTINDDRKAIECRRKKLCSVCGKKLHGDMWFVGGTRCFLHEFGAFLDPPVHLECAEYSLRVCPFLAATKYSRGVEDRKLNPKAVPDNLRLVKSEFMFPRLPERFGLGLTDDYEFHVKGTQGPGVYVVNRWRYVEFWRAGEPCPPPESGLPPPDPS